MRGEPAEQRRQRDARSYREPQAVAELAHELAMKIDVERHDDGCRLRVGNSGLRRGGDEAKEPASCSRTPDPTVSDASAGGADHAGSVPSSKLSDVYKRLPSGAVTATDRS